MTTPAFAVDVEVAARRARLTGALTGDTACLVEATLAELCGSAGPPVTVDARAVTLLDGDGLACVGRLAETARRSGTTLVLLGSASDRGTDVSVPVQAPGRNAG